jgi:hypothetical protein
MKIRENYDISISKKESSYLFHHKGNPIKIVSKLLVVIVLMSLVLSIGCSSPDGESNDDTGDSYSNTDYHSLFMGHSFFIPIAEGMQEHAHRAGFIGHTQHTVFSGGAGGAPQALWEDASKRNAIQDILNSGDIDLFGMTYHAEYPSVDGYINWVEYALQQNPDTKFFIGVPWAAYPDNGNSTTYWSNWDMFHLQIIHGLIDTLGADYPENAFYCIPYGQGAIELYRLFESGDLSDVQTLIRVNGSESIFTDSLGHPDDILITIGQLIWLNAIYGFDLNDYDYDTGYVCDLKGIAQGIMKLHDPNHNSP